MYATQDLRDEHEGIKVVLAVLKHLAAEMEADKPVNTQDLEQIVDFLKTFADRCHHGKEEDLLFPALEAVGIPREGGPIGVMLAEHTEGREYIRGMTDSLPGVGSGAAADRKAFVQSALGYVNLLNSHIEKENSVLFVMAETRLPPEEHKKLSEGFDQIENERIGPGVHERYHAMIDRLSDTYLG